MKRLLPVLLLSACSEDIVVGELQEVATIKAIPNRDVDLLFVVDNSQSMVVEQEKLAAAFPQMMDVLATVDGGLPNLHIGVITSDLGTSGRSGNPAPTVGLPNGGGGCASGYGDAGALQGRSSAVEGLFISDLGLPDGSRERNYTGELRDVFAANALVGDQGCGFEQHLSALEASLSHPSNAGFFRPEANLAVVIIANEDDCSTEDASAFFGEDLSQLSFKCTKRGVTCDQALDSLGHKTHCVATGDEQIRDVAGIADAVLAAKGDPRRVMTAVIGGDVDGTLTVRANASPFEDALIADQPCGELPDGSPTSVISGIRLAAFADHFAGRSTFTSLCSGDLLSPLHQIGGSAKKLIADPCLDSSQLADASPEPGLQPSCEVLDTRDSAPDAAVTLLPCDERGGDCYEIVPDAAACPFTPDHSRLVFHRAETTDDLWTSVRCQLR